MEAPSGHVSQGVRGGSRCEMRIANRFAVASHHIAARVGGSPVEWILPELEPPRGKRHPVIRPLR